MREGTSGFWVSEDKDKIAIGYEDYGVSEFGGGDFEKTYYLEGENAEKFRLALAESYSGTLEEMIEQAFGRGFEDPKFWNFCRTRGIVYSSETWSG